MTAVTLFYEELLRLPAPFSVLLTKLCEEYADPSETSLNLALYGAVLYIIMEMGFLPLNINHETLQFNWTALNDACEQPIEKILTKKINNTVYESYLKLGSDTNCSLIVRGLSSEDSNSHLTINTIWNVYDGKTKKREPKIASLHLNTYDFVEKKQSKFVFKKRRELSIAVKDKLAYEPRSYFSCQYSVLHGHLFSLPLEVQRLISNRLPNDAKLF